MIFANQEACALLHTPQEAWSHNLWYGIDVHLTLLGWRNKRQELASSNKPLRYETELSGDGERFIPVSVNLIQLEQDRYIAILEDRLCSGDAKFRQRYLEKRSGIAAWSYNCIRDEWVFSEHFFQLLGVDQPAATLSPASCEELFRKHFSESEHLQIKEALQAAVHQRQPLHIELARNSGSSAKKLVLSGTVYRNELHPLRIVGSLQSISQAEEQAEPASRADVLPADLQQLELTQFSTDMAPDLIFWTLPDGSFAYVNRQVVKKLQFSLPEFQSMSVQVIAPYFDEEVRCQFWERLREEGNFEEEYELTAADGSTITVLGHVNYIKFGQQEIACSFCRDITESKQEAFRSRLAEFTIDSSADMVIWVGPDGHIRYFNDSFLKKSGYTAESIKGKQTKDFFPIASPEEREELWKELREKGFYSTETTLFTASGQEVPVRAEYYFIRYEEQEYKCVFFRDWTEKKERDLRLRLATEVFSTASEAIVWLEEDGRIKHVNEAMLAYAGGKAEGWEGKPLGDLFPKLTLERLMTDSVLEHSMPSKQGGTVYLELTTSSFKHDGRIYLMIIGRNFTERYLRRKQLAESQRRVEELTARLQAENIVLREDVEKEFGVDNIITVSPNYRKVLQQVGRVAETNTTVLILGETGTGKELLARAVHQLSDRADFPLIKVNCAALPENLIESELFGHEKGAFTGAVERKKGRFELAHKGTLFLDEIGELPLALQAKLLRVLQEGEMERLGGQSTIKVDVRLIAATNRSLEDMVQKGNFRTDLFYRLNVFPINNLPLRERPEDIKVLTEHFVSKFATRQGKDIKQINGADLKKLQDYHFPGNVRELENIIERAVVLCNNTTLEIPFEATDRSVVQSNGFPSFDEMQRDYIIQALKKTQGRVTGPNGAGRLLGLNDRTLMSKIRKFQIEKREYYS